MDKKKLGNSIFDGCDDMTDYLFKDIIKDIEYAYEHKIKVNKLPNEYKLKVALIKSLQEVYKNEIPHDDIEDCDEIVETYKL